METNEALYLEQNTNRWKFINATALKLVAVIFMFLDHIHQMFVHVGAPIWLTMLGRLVFPMFLFASAESFYHTHSKKKYLQHLLFASWGMTLFTVALQSILPNPHVVLMNNAFSTFFITALYMLFWDRFVDGIQNKKPVQVGKAVLYCMLPVLGAVPLFLVAGLSLNENIPFPVIKTLITIAMLVPNVIAIEGGVAMVALGVSFYIFRKYRVIQITILLSLSAVVYLIGDNIQWMMCFAAIPIALYNGERGKGMRNFFYVIYPLHIGVLYIISTIFFR